MRIRYRPGIALVLFCVSLTACRAPASTEARPAGCEDWQAGRLSVFFESATADEVASCLEEGADANMPDDRGRTPLHLAARYIGDPAAINTLVEAGAEVNARDDGRATALHAAWDNANPAVVHALLELGADPLARNDRGKLADPAHCRNWNTPVFARTASADAVAGCIDSGADLHARDDDGNTPLHHAALQDNTRNMALLVEAGTGVNVRNGQGQTPLHYAATNPNAAVAALLLEAGAEVNSRDAIPVSRTLGRVPPYVRVPAARTPPPAARSRSTRRPGATTSPSSPGSWRPAPTSTPATSRAPLRCFRRLRAETATREVPGIRRSLKRCWRRGPT